MCIYRLLLIRFIYCVYVRGVWGKILWLIIEIGWYWLNDFSFVIKICIVLGDICMIVMIVFVINYMKLFLFDKVYMNWVKLCKFLYCWFLYYIDRRVSLDFIYSLF